MIAVGDWQLGAGPVLDGGDLRFLGLRGGRPVELLIANRNDPHLDRLDGQLRLASEVPPPWLYSWPSVRVDPAWALLPRERVTGVTLHALLMAASRSKQNLSFAAACAVSLAVALAYRDDPTPPATPLGLIVEPNGELRFRAEEGWNERARIHPQRTFVLYPPEVLRGRAASARNAAFRPAAALMFCLTGRSPFESGTEFNTLDATLAGGLTSDLHALPAALNEAVRAALRPEHETPPGLPALIALLEPYADREALAREVNELASAELRRERDLDAWLRGRDPDQLPDDLVQTLSTRDDADALKVAADWLLAQGRPRGELAALQLAGTEAANERANALLKNDPLLLPHRTAIHPNSWRGGWLWELTLRHVEQPWWEAVLLKHPSARFLRKIRVLAPEAASLRMVEAIALAKPACLQSLELAVNHEYGARALSSFERLEVTALR